jgi:hypothetical protein
MARRTQAIVLLDTYIAVWLYAGLLVTADEEIKTHLDLAVW